MNEWQALRSSMRNLRSFAAKDPAERCELCASEVPERHQHLIDPDSRKVVCSCDGCAVLFDSGGVTKLRRIPRDVFLISDFRLEEEDWKRLLVPISLGFFSRSSRTGQVSASYPSPAGVTESQIDSEAWEAVKDSNPVLRGLRDDVEALLVNRLRDEREYYIAPIDRCFELVGVVRENWRGMTGGDLVWDRVRSCLGQMRREAIGRTRA